MWQVKLLVELKNHRILLLEPMEQLLEIKTKQVVHSRHLVMISPMDQKLKMFTLK